MVKPTRKSQIVKAKKSSETLKNTTHRVMILPKKSVGTDDEEERQLILKLRTPRNDDGDLYLMDQQQCLLYQLLSFVESPRSWFFNDNGYKDGSITFATPVDPLFLVLPYLKECEKYRPLDHILSDGDFPDCNILLSSQNIHTRITSIADRKETGDLVAYRYNETRCMVWLFTKVHNLARMLQKKGVCVSSGAQAATFVRSKKDFVANHDNYLKCAYDLISDYLPEDVAEAFSSYLGLVPSVVQSQIEELDEPPKKKPKLDNEEESVTDHVTATEKGPRKAKTSLKKLTVTQKILQKVDKTGIKDISSFFAKKT